MPADVAHAYLWENGMTMVFDRFGEQIPDLQGPHTPELEQAIRERALPGAKLTGFDGVRETWPRGGFSGNRRTRT